MCAKNTGYQKITTELCKVGIVILVQEQKCKQANHMTIGRMMHDASGGEIHDA